MQGFGIWTALIVSTLAGLATLIGALAALAAHRPGKGLLTLGMGFSAGVMIYVSFVELLPQGALQMAAGLGSIPARWWATGAFFAGGLLFATIDRLVPGPENPHELGAALDVEACENEPTTEGASPSGNAALDPRHHAAHPARLMRTGLLTAAALTLHNFPEGIATFVGAQTDVRLGVSVGVAVAIHNIPEGIAVALPIHHATGSRRKAMLYALVCALAEPVGALVGFFLLSSLLGPGLAGALLAITAGIMVFVSLDQLLPAAEEYGHHHLSIIGVGAGMGVMALSLLLLGP